MHKKLSLLTLLLLPFTDVIAVEWTSIIKDTQHEVLVDIDSYNVSEGYPYLDAKIIYQVPQAFAFLDKQIRYAVSITTYQFNCKQPLHRVRSIKLMTEKNKLIDTVKISDGFSKLKMNTDAFSVGQLTCQVHQMLGG